MSQPKKINNNTENGSQSKETAIHSSVTDANMHESETHISNEGTKKIFYLTLYFLVKENHH